MPPKATHCPSHLWTLCHSLPNSQDATYFCTTQCLPSANPFCQMSLLDMLCALCLENRSRVSCVRGPVPQFLGVSVAHAYAATVVVRDVGCHRFWERVHSLAAEVSSWYRDGSHQEDNLRARSFQPRGMRCSQSLRHSVGSLTIGLMSIEFSALDEQDPTCVFFVPPKDLGSTRNQTCFWWGILQGLHDLPWLPAIRTVEEPDGFCWRVWRFWSTDEWDHLAGTSLWHLRRFI